MAIEITDRTDLKEKRMPFISDRRLFLNADKTKVVDENDPDATFLLVGEGGELTDEEAEQYGLKSSAKTEDKAVDAPAEDKASRPSRRGK